MLAPGRPVRRLLLAASAFLVALTAITFLPAAPSSAQAGPACTGIVYRDDNTNGVRDTAFPGEPGVAGVTVEITWLGGSTSTQTADDGSWQLNVPPATELRVVVSDFGPLLPGPVGVDSGSTVVFLNSTSCDAGSEILVNVVDAPLCREPIIQLGNRIWADLLPPAEGGTPGVQDPGEPGLAGVTVSLYDAGGTLVASTITDDAGEYYFDGSNVPGGVLPTTDYEIRLDNPADYLAGGPLDGFLLTAPGAGIDDQVDSDGTLAGTGTFGVDDFPAIPVTTGSAGATDHTLDVGFNPPATIGDRVWIDSDGDGVFDLGEPPIAGVEVMLTALATGATSTTVTDAAGNYYFQNLEPGDYQVTVDAGQPGFPVGVGITTDGDGPADGVHNKLGLVAGEVYLAADFGYQPLFDLEISKEITSGLVDGEFALGSNAGWQLAVENLGPASAPGPITVVDVLPTNAPASDTTVVAQPGWTCDVTDGPTTVTCTSFAALPAAPGVPVVVADVTYPLDDRITSGLDLNTLHENTATVAGPVPDTIGDPANTVTVGAPVARWELAITKDVLTPQPVAFGDEIQFSIEVTNTGTSNAYPVVSDPATALFPQIVEYFPLLWTNVDGGPDWDCTLDIALEPNPPIECTYLPAAGLPNGATAPPIIITALASGEHYQGLPLTGEYVDINLWVLVFITGGFAPAPAVNGDGSAYQAPNIASVGNPAAPQMEADGSNNFAEASFEYEIPDLRIYKRRVSTNPIGATQPAQWEIQVRNEGFGPFTEPTITVEEYITADQTYVGFSTGVAPGWTGGTWSCTEVDAITVSCEIANPGGVASQPNGTWPDLAPPVIPPLIIDTVYNPDAVIPGGTSTQNRTCVIDVGAELYPLLHAPRDLFRAGNAAGDRLTWNNGTANGPFILLNNCTTAQAGPPPDVIDLGILKATLTASPAVAGQDVEFELLVQNFDPDTEEITIVTDTLPPELAFNEAATLAANDGTYTATFTGGPGGEVVTFTRTSPLTFDPTPATIIWDPAEANVDRIVLVTTVVSDGQPTISNTAAVSGASGTQNPETPGPNTDNDSIDLLGSDLLLSKTNSGGSPFGLGPPAPTFDWLVDVSNAGPAAKLAPIVVTDTLPDGMTWTGTGGVADGNGWTCTQSEQVLTCEHPDAIPSGGAAPQLVIPVEAAAGVAATVTNTATVAGATPDNPDNLPNTDADSVAFIGPNVDVVKMLSNTPIRGGQASWTIEVSTAGGDAGSTVALPVTVTDELPLGTTYAGFSGGNVDGDWVCTDPAAVVAGPNGGDLVTCTWSAGTDPLPINTPLPLLRLDSTVALDYVTNPDGDDIANCAEVSIAQLEITYDDNESCAGGELGPDVADLGIVKTGAEANSTTYGNDTTYDIVVTNFGPSAAEGPIVVTDILPAGTTYVADSGGDWACTVADREVLCELATGLDPGVSTPTLSITANIGPLAGAQIENVASVVSSTAEPATGGASNLDSHVVVVEKACFGDTVWHDIDGDGVQQLTEPPLAGVTLTTTWFGPDGVLGGGDDVVYTTETDAAGQYSFENLPPGGYDVLVDESTIPDPALMASYDLDGILDSETMLLLAGGDQRRDVDWGYNLMAALGDYVWLDVNADGVQDPGEAGIEGVVVNLLDDTGAVIATTTTDADGLYLFDGLVPGEYQVQFVAPAGYVPSPQDQGDDATDSDADPATGLTTATTLVSGETDLTWDAGFYELAALGDYVWLDVNADGIQDPTETGIEGITVNLLDSTGTVLATTTTDADGLYLFDGLTPGVEYVVRVVAPAGMVVSPQDQGDDDAVDSDIDPATGETIGIVLDSGETDLTWDAGVYELASLGDYVWDDLNADGIQDPGEAGIEGVVVNLLDDTGAVIATTTTDADGLYLFDGLVPGEYQVQFVAPAGYVPSPQDQGDDATDSDADPVTGLTAVTTLDSGENDLTWDAGYYQTTAIGDYVWLDVNADGVQDPGEAGIEGVVVNLLDDTGAVIATTTTDADGLYLFDGLVPGEYQVQFVAPAGYVPSPQDQGDDATDSDADPATGLTTATTLVSGETDLTWDAGFYELAALGDYVWLDVNADGIQDPTETGIEGITVNLLDSTGTVLATTTTDADGLYLFDGLTPGVEYVVRVVAPAGMVVSPQDQGDDDAVDSDIDPATGETIGIVLDSGETDLTWDAGVYELASLGDYVWDDLNADGIQDPGEAGIEGVVVNLLDDTGAVIATTTTDADGLYLFDGLVPGEYQVQFVAPAGYVPSPQDQGDDATDSDADPVTGLTAVTTLDSGENDLTWDAGYYQTTAIGDYVWLDVNADGVQDPGEAGIEGVVVNLLDDTGAVIATTTTDADGLYLFDGLVPGEYQVQFVAPAGYVPSPQDQGDDATDSDADPATGLTTATTLVSGETDLTWDAGFYELAALGDYVWLDVNADGIQDPTETGIEGITVNLLDSTGTVLATTTTDADGLYLFDGLTPGVEYVVRVVAPAGMVVSPQDQGDDDAVDSDIDPATGETIGIVLDSGETDLTWDAGVYELASLGDYVWDDLNADGIQDPGEAGIEGVVVNLLDDTGAVIATTTTDADGLYLFDGLVPGEYQVQFVAPAGYVPSPQDQGDDATDSDADPVTGLTAVTTLDSGENDLTWDAGYYQTTAIGDYVWLDVNADGVQDPGEAGIEGVVVNLLDDTGAVIATTTTDPSGFYLFADLIAGTYQVRFLSPAGFSASPADAGADDAADSDADPITGLSPTVTLVGNEVNLTIDAGFVPLVSLGDYVWLDVNADGIQDPTETGIEGITVNLLDSTGTVLATTTTDAAGKYVFADLPSGTYQVEFVTPANYGLTLQTGGGDATADSDPDPATGLTGLVLLAGVDRLDVDAGLIVTTVDLALSKAVTGEPITGGTARYTLAVTNIGPTPGLGVTVTDGLPTELAYVAASGTSWNCTETTGVVTCEYMIALLSGETATIDLETTVLAANGAITNSATVVSSAVESNIDDNASSAVFVLQVDEALPVTGAPIRRVLELGSWLLLLGLVLVATGRLAPRRKTHAR